MDDRRRFLIGSAAFALGSAAAMRGAAQSVVTPYDRVDPARAEAIRSGAFATDPSVTNYADDPRPSQDRPMQQGEAKRRNISSFSTRDWQDYFPSLANGAILCDTKARALHFWNESDTVYKLYPTSVPLTQELTRRGRTSIIRKQVGPDWAPTASMLARDPSLPRYVPPGPSNPLGTHALYLSWQYYRIHGTHDTRKIGRRSSSGCIGLYNEHIAELFGLAQIGTQVLLI